MAARSSSTTLRRFRRRRRSPCRERLRARRKRHGEDRALSIYLKRLKPGIRLEFHFGKRRLGPLDRRQPHHLARDERDDQQATRFAESRCGPRGKRLAPSDTAPLTIECLQRVIERRHEHEVLANDRCAHKARQAPLLLPLPRRLRLIWAIECENRLGARDVRFARSGDDGLWWRCDGRLAEDIARRQVEPDD
jgi:hypothetical protein